MIELLTAALVLITGFYAYLTHRLAVASERSVQAAERHLEATLRPYITIRPYVRPNTPFLYLAVINTGASGATDLTMKLDRDFYQFGEHKRSERNLRNVSAFSSPITSFAPGQELHFALGQGWVIFAKETNPAVTPLEFSVNVTYRFADKAVTELHRIDLRPYVGSEENRDPIVQELEKIRKALTAGVAAQQAVQADGPASGGSAA